MAGERIYLDNEDGPTTIGFVKAQLAKALKIEGVDDETELQSGYDAGLFRERLCIVGPMVYKDMTVDELLNIAKGSSDVMEREVAMNNIIERAKAAEA